MRLVLECVFVPQELAGRDNSFSLRKDALHLPAVLVSESAQHRRPGYPWIELGQMGPVTEIGEE